MKNPSIVIIRSRPVRLLTGALALLLGAQCLLACNKIAYVSDGTNRWSNWDIYTLDIDSGERTRLTTHPAIDNHPTVSPDGQWVVFSSNRGGSGEFDLYLGSVTNVEGTLQQLTFDTYPNGPQLSYPDRHPHWHPDGKTVVFTSKNRPLDRPIEIASECSVPVIIVPPRFFEGLNMIQMDLTGAVTNYVELDIRDAWDRTTFPSIWVEHTGTYVGHPSFSHDGTKLLFSAAIDGEGTEWEVYWVGFDPETASLIPNSLRRVTFGPAVGPNPIQMSAGAHFSEDDTEIYFSSTRTPLGNSQIFKVPATSLDMPISGATQLTSHGGNDYVPEPLTNGFIVVSDLGTNTLCGEELGPTDDLDLVFVGAGGVRTILGDESANEMFLIADEVSWFCGMKPNLCDCTFIPRIMRGEALYLAKTALLYLNGYVPSTPIPANLMARFNYPNQAIRLYALAFLNTEAYMKQHAPLEWSKVEHTLMFLHQSTALLGGFLSLTNEALLRNWLMSTAQWRNQKFVVPSIMYEHGLGSPLPTQPVAHIGLNATPEPTLTLSWPLYWPECRVLSSDSLAPSSEWLPLLQTPTADKGVNKLTITPSTTDSKNFYRLVTPVEHF